MGNRTSLSAVVVVLSFAATETLASADEGPAPSDVPRPPTVHVRIRHVDGKVGSALIKVDRRAVGGRLCDLPCEADVRPQSFVIARWDDGKTSERFVVYGETGQTVDVILHSGHSTAAYVGAGILATLGAGLLAAGIVGLAATGQAGGGGWDLSPVARGAGAVAVGLSLPFFIGTVAILASEGGFSEQHVDRTETREPPRAARRPFVTPVSLTVSF
jgi:hypothetical protein